MSTFIVGCITIPVIVYTPTTLSNPAFEFSTMYFTVSSDAKGANCTNVDDTNVHLSYNVTHFKGVPKMWGFPQT